MSRRSVIIGLLVLSCGVLVVLAGVEWAPPGPDAGELARRAAASQPTWPNYEEDIKAQVGATPVAEWEGELRHVQRDGSVIRVTFRVTGPWALRDAAIPVLLREPRGGVHRNARAECRGGSATYVFEWAGETPGAALPWIEIKYPGGEKRLVLSEAGSWDSTD